MKHELYSSDPDGWGLETEEIEEMTTNEVHELIRIWCGSCKKAKRTRAICWDKDVWVAVDNSTKDCWVEEFDDKQKAIDWLDRKFEV